MTGVAGGGAVAVTADTLVNVVRLSLLVSRGRMAIDASETRVVRRDLMAVVTYRSVMRDLEIRVIECGAQPTGGRVAGVARLRLAGCDVVWHGATKCLRAEPRRLVAPVTRGVSRTQGVIVADVTIRAGGDLGARRRGHLVRAGKSPTGGAVIKRSRIPGSGVMAGGTK